MNRNARKSKPRGRSTKRKTSSREKTNPGRKAQITNPVMDEIVGRRGQPAEPR
jgi:hypothetical protein